MKRILILAMLGLMLLPTGARAGAGKSADEVLLLRHALLVGG